MGEDKRRVTILKMDNHIREAITILKNGGIVIFPTDTAYGIGCRVDNTDAIERLFRIRKRPKNQPVPILVDSVEMAKNYVKTIPEDVAYRLIKPYWPGALTIILPSKIDMVPSLVRGGGKTIGVRIPNNKIIRTIIHGVGVPILGPSANFHQDKTPYIFEDLNPRLLKLADYALKGQCALKKESTIIDCSKKPWKILREGALKLTFAL